MVLDLIANLMASTFAADVNDVAVMVKILVGGDDQSAPWFDSCMTVPHPYGAENGPLGKRRRELMADARQKVVSSVSQSLVEEISRVLENNQISRPPRGCHVSHVFQSVKAMGNEQAFSSGPAHRKDRCSVRTKDADEQASSRAYDR